MNLPTSQSDNVSRVALRLQRFEDINVLVRDVDLCSSQQFEVSAQTKMNGSIRR